VVVAQNKTLQLQESKNLYLKKILVTYKINFIFTKIEDIKQLSIGRRSWAKRSKVS